MVRATDCDVASLLLSKGRVSFVGMTGVEVHMQAPWLAAKGMVSCSIFTASNPKP